MVRPLEEIAEKIALESKLGEITAFQLLSGGRNNRVAKVELSGSSYLLKNYFYSVHDQRDRLNNEYSFADFAWSSGCRCIPKPVFRSNGLRSALYEYVPGIVVNSRSVSMNDIAQAIDFVMGINKQKAKAPENFPVASEAGFSITEHVENTERRVKRLSEITGDSSAAIAVRNQIDERIIPLWNKVVRAVKTVLANDKSLAKDLKPNERWLSPSDFGFHNAIQKADGEIIFVDFEFAGWDDPVKLICDFANQPDNILRDDFSGKFRQKIFESQPVSDRIRDRHRILQPVFQLKWVCIILNHFLPLGKDRNLFTNSENLEKKQTEQITKMERMLGRAEASSAFI